MRRLITLSVILSVTLGVAEAQRRRRNQPSYLSYAERCADTLLTHGLDVHGPKQTPLWAAVIDAETLEVPENDVPAPPGVRENDRAVGGANLYHEAVTLRVFRVLSALAGEPKYADGARRYMNAYLDLARSRNTGLLAWGEHLYYNFFRDEVAAERQWHELLGWTPPWEELWEVNPDAVAQAIAGLRYHYYADDPKTLFNRHAFWNRAIHQPPGGQPWIKHSGLYAYSFMFLHRKTNDRRWLGWSRAAANVHWSRRNAQTNLTASCIGDPRPQSRLASSGQAQLAYWLLKTYRLNPRETETWKRAVALLKAYDLYAYDPERNTYASRLSLDGAPANAETSSAWDFAYGSPTILPFGRVAAYFARAEQDPAFEEMARRAAQIAKATPIPDDVSLQGFAFALNLSLDLYELTRERGFLTDARTYADGAIKRFWVETPNNGGLFVRLPDDRYYEAKAGVGDLLAGLLRLHIHGNRYVRDPGLYDWSF